MFNKPQIIFTGDNPDTLDWDSLVFAEVGEHKTFSAALTDETPTVYASATKSITKDIRDLDDGLKLPLMVTTSPIKIVEMRCVLLNAGLLMVDLMHNAHYDGSGTGNALGDYSTEVSNTLIGNINSQTMVIPENRFVWAELSEYQGGGDQLVVTIEYLLEHT